MALPIIAGYWLDERLNSSPWFLLTGIFLGVASSVWTILKLAIEENIKDKKKKTDRERALKTSDKETFNN
jgi:F0F1-type ATP synthase assembly protein I